VSDGSDRPIIVWDLQSKKIAHRLTGHKNPIMRWRLARIAAQSHPQARIETAPRLIALAMRRVRMAATADRPVRLYTMVRLQKTVPGKETQMRSFAVFVSCLISCLIVSGGLAPAGDKKQVATDKEGFHIARKAAAVRTWDAAIELLDEVKLSKLDDTDVIEYVVFLRLCARTAQALGVDRKSNPDSPTDVVTKIDWPTLIATLGGKVAQDPTGALKLLNDARKVYNGIENYQKLDSKLVDRYGSK
jgi:hypothetical protein